MRAFPILALFCLMACRGQEFGAPCDDNDDCERKLECRPTEDAPQSAVGQVCSEECDENSECACWGGTCVRECEVTAPDCPDGSICAVLESPFEGPRSYCVLPCASADECRLPYPYCPEVGGPCSREEGEVPPWSATP